MPHGPGRARKMSRKVRKRAFVKNFPSPNGPITTTKLEPAEVRRIIKESLARARG